MDVLEADAQRAVRKLPRVGGLWQRPNPLEPGEAASRRGDRTLAEVDDPAERLERPHQLQQQADEEHELADRELARDHIPAAEEEHGRDPERRQEEQAGEVVGLDACLPHRLVPHRFGPAEEAGAHVLLAAERLHHLDPDDRLVGRLGQVALLRLDESRDREEPVREPVGQDRDRRHRERREERQPRVHAYEHDRRRDDHHRALDALDDAPADEVADRVDVVRRPRDHLAGRVPVEEFTRVREIGVVEQPAEACLDRDPDAGRGEPAREVDGEPQHREQEDRAEVRQQQVVVVPTTASSTTREIRIGIVIESAVKASAKTSPIPTRRRCSHQRGTSRSRVGRSPRSGGSTCSTGALEATSARPSIPLGNWA